MGHTVTLTGSSLTLGDVAAVARDFSTVSLDSGAAARLEASRAVVERAAASDAAVYGLNTGFGKLASVRISPGDLVQLQRNLILSHASGLGDPLPIELVRAIMLLRANVLLKETSGVRPSLPQRIADMLNAGIHPLVPEQGSVGASGDLAPLSHIGRALLGEGDVDVVAPESGGAPHATRESAAGALERAGLAPFVFEAKEGLSFVNGTQAQTAVLALLVYDTRSLLLAAHTAAAMSLEALKGTPDAFDARIHEARPHPGQQRSAALLRELLAGSEIRESHRAGDPRVQDAYSVRCTPQVLGSVWDTVEYAAGTAATELNSATDNPLVFGDEILSGGNFHGQPIAMALDFLAIAITTLAGLSERRLERIVNPDLSPGLPAFLARNPGLESGLMMVQIAAAALVGECRSLCGPASVQSIPTDANQEDFVSMGMAAAFKARRIFMNARHVIACELLCAAEGLEHHRPLKAGAGVERAHARVRQLVPPLSGDRALTQDLEAITRLIAEEALI